LQRKFANEILKCGLISHVASFSVDLYLHDSLDD